MNVLLAMLFAVYALDAKHGDEDEWPRYTDLAMDKVRLGRALGYGVRHAAKAAAQAVEAATTPDPSRNGPAQPQVMAKPRVVQQTQRAARSAGRSFFAPLASFSKTLWLEVTGSFFALMALSMGAAAWKIRGAVHLPSASTEAHKLYVCVGIFLVFAYFAVTSFVRARRTQA